jgi:hypothetical protein
VIAPETTTPPEDPRVVAGRHRAELARILTALLRTEWGLTPVGLVLERVGSENQPNLQKHLDELVELGLVVRPWRDVPAYKASLRCHRLYAAACRALGMDSEAAVGRLS